MFGWDATQLLLASGTIADSQALGIPAVSANLPFVAFEPL